MKTYNLFDVNFAGSEVTQGFDAASKTKPERGQWIRNQMSWEGTTVFTDDACFHPVAWQSSCSMKVAWLLESPGVKGQVYESIHSVQDNFDYIFTFLPLEIAKSLKIDESKYVHCPIGGAWVSPVGDVKIDKSKLVSLIASEKNYLPGHQLRHHIAKSIGGVDLFGRAYNPIDDKSAALDSYAFSFVVENFPISGYFTEKLIDSFLRMTVPVYWGDPDIGKVFNPDGILCIDDIDRLSFDLYESKRDCIRENYEIALRYKSNDDLVFDRIEEIESR